MNSEINKMYKKPYQPFYQGTLAVEWYCANCERCTKAYFPKDGEYPSDVTMKKYIWIGKECKLKYALDYGFITGYIEDDIASQIGKGEFCLKQSCMMYSDNDDDRWQPPKRIKPIDDNQLVMGFIIDDLLPDHVNQPTTCNTQLETCNL